MKRSTLALAVPLLVAVSFARPASAQSATASDGSQAEALYKEAVALFKAGNVKAACTKLDESYKLEAATQTLFSLAKCRQREGRFATAWTQLTEVVRRGEREGDATKLADYRAKLAEVEARVPRVVLKLEARPEVSDVKVDGRALARSEWSAPVRLDPGEHTFVFSGPGKLDTVKKATLAEGETITFEIDPLREPAPATAATPSSTATSSESSTKSDGGSSPTLGYILGGAGIAAIGVGAVTGLVAMNHKDTADDRFARRDPSFKESDDAASTTALVSTIAFAVGVVGLGAGTYLVLTNGPKKTGATTFQVGASADRIVLGGRF